MNSFFNVLTLFVLLQTHVQCGAADALVQAEESCQGTGTEARSASLLQAKVNEPTRMSLTAVDKLQGSSCPEREQRIIPVFDSKQMLNDLTPEPVSIKLGFIHIPQNSAHAIEAAGLKSGINWGSNAINRTYVQKIQLTKDRMCTWDMVPPRYLPAVEIYENRPLFCVTRDPIERFFATYLFFMDMVRHQCPMSRHDYNLLNHFDGCTPQSLNYFAKEALVRVRENIFDFDCNLIPQSTYIWDWDGNQDCNDFLEFKTLDKDFNSVMVKYSLSATLGEASLLQTDYDRNGLTHDVTQETARICPDLTIADFDESSVVELRHFYEQDYQLLGYK